jgi:peptide/nickel transport system substrate-binding protein
MLLGCNSKNELKIGILNMPMSLQSFKIRDGVSFLVGRQIHRGLISLDVNTGSYEGEMASKWMYSADKRSIIFSLKKNIYFHDGTIVSCADVKSSFDNLLLSERETSITFPVGTKFSCDGSEFRISMPYIPAQFFEMMASPAAGISKGNGLIGIGPYKIVSSGKAEIILESINPDSIHQLRFVIADKDALINKFKNGEIDDISYIGFFSDVDIDCQKITGLTPTSFWLGINSKSWNFQNERIRKAVQKLLILSLEEFPIFDKERPIKSLIPFGVTGSRLPSSDDRYISKEMIKEVKKSVAKFGKIKVTLRSSHRYDYKWAEWFKHFEKNGDFFDVEYLDNTAFFERYYRHDLSLFFVGANVTRNDPFEILSFFRSKDPVNPSQIQSDFIDKLLERATKAESVDEVRSLADQADQWILKHAYAVPLFSKRFSGCVSKKLQGYELSPMGPMAPDYSRVRFR